MNALQVPASIAGCPCSAALLASVVKQTIRHTGSPAGAKQGEQT